MLRILTAVISGLLVATGAWAQDKEKSDKQTAQQARMKSCNAQANKKDMKGDERKAFMSDCLKSEKKALTAQQKKMRSCNVQAKKQDLKGDERKEFMSKCLKADSGTAAS